ncbi:MAG: DNA polymerase domain-containing protein, partial [Nanoarchaeota archaeon]
MTEYSFVDNLREFYDGKPIVNTYAFYWETIDGIPIKKYDKIENKDYYFYIDEGESFKVDTRKIKIYKDKYKTINGKTCIKIEPYDNLTSTQFKQLREQFNVTYESDMPALTRWIANNKPKYEKNVRKLYIDIETIKREDGSYSNPDISEAPIIMITCYDSFSEKYITFLYKKTNEKNTMVFDNEIEMLKGFIKYLRAIKPDYILGWNIESYDIPYIINRMVKLNLNYHELSPLNYVTHRKVSDVSSHKFSSFYIYIRGIGVFDLIIAAQRLWLGKFCGYSLDKMSEYHLKKKKIIIEDIDEAYEKEINKLIQYNIKDVELCVELDKHLELFKKFQSFQDIMSINVHSALTQSNNIIQYILQNTTIVLLNSNHKADRATYKGGFVLDSVPGIYKKCYKFDFVSMYPTIMITYNISPETILNHEKLGCINMDNKFFFKKEKGIITKVMEELLEKRLKYKIEKNEELSLVYKLLMNSIYGQFAAPYSRIYNFDCGQATTYQGRRMITELMNKTKETINGKIILGDTDSIVFHSDKDFEYKTILSLFNAILERIYEIDNIQDNKQISLELEKIIDKMIIFGNEKGG